MALARGEPAEHVCYCNPHMSDAGTTAALARLDGDDVLGSSHTKPSIIPGSVRHRFKMHFRFRRLPPNGYVAEVVMDEKPIGQSKNAKTATFIDWMSKPLRNPQALSSRFIAR